MKAIVSFLLLLAFSAGPANSSTPVTSKKIVVSKVVKVPIEKVWWIWTTTEGLKTFFGDGNRIGLEPGGPFEIYFNMSKPEGERGSEGCKVLSYLPMEMLSFSWSAPPKFPEVRNGDKTWVVVTFHSIDKNATEVTLNHIGWKEGTQWNEVYSYFQQAWPGVMESMENALKGK